MGEPRVQAKSWCCPPPPTAHRGPLAGGGRLATPEERSRARPATGGATRRWRCSTGWALRRPQAGECARAGCGGSQLARARRRSVGLTPPEPSSGPAGRGVSHRIAERLATSARCVVAALGRPAACAVPGARRQGFLDTKPRGGFRKLGFPEAPSSSSQDFTGGALGRHRPLFARAHQHASRFRPGRARRALNLDPRGCRCFDGPMPSAAKTRP